MSGNNTEDLPGSAPVLNATLLARIHALNLDYLDLLVAEHASADCAAQLQHLPRRLHSAIVALSGAARSLLAALPFTLYSLGFEDQGFWRMVCEPTATCPQMGTAAAIPIEQRYAPDGPSWSQGSFCEVALLHAWHVATSNPLASRVLYAMPDATARRLAATPLWLLKRIAAEHPALLLPRWPTNPGFWPDLVRFAALQDARRLATAKLLGSQLIASELESASTERPSARRAARPPGSPRLRARKLRFELGGRRRIADGG